MQKRQASRAERRRGAAPSRPPQGRTAGEPAAMEIPGDIMRRESELYARRAVSLLQLPAQAVPARAEEHHRGGDVDGGIGAHEHAQQHGHRKVAHGRAAEKIETDKNRQGGSRRQQGARQRGVDGLVHDLLHRFRRQSRAEALADAVVNDDGVVDRIAGHRQESAYMNDAQLAAGQNHQPDHRQHVVQCRNERPEGEGPFIAQGQVEHDAEHAGDQSPDGGAEERAAQRRAHAFDGGWREFPHARQLAVERVDHLSRIGLVGAADLEIVGRLVVFEFLRRGRL